MPELFLLSALAVVCCAVAAGALLARFRTRAVRLGRAMLDARPTPTLALTATAAPPDHDGARPRRAHRPRGVRLRHDYDLMIGRTFFH
jgi:hypothetical protein